jgi:hypothetical protein
VRVVALNLHIRIQESVQPESDVLQLAPVQSGINKSQLVVPRTQLEAAQRNGFAKFWLYVKYGAQRITSVQTRNLNFASWSARSLRM